MAAYSVSNIVESLRTEYMAIIDKLAALPAGSVSSMGRNISADRGQLTERMKTIQETLAQLGYPIGEINTPFVQVSRVRP